MCLVLFVAQVCVEKKMVLDCDSPDQLFPTVAASDLRSLCYDKKIKNTDKINDCKHWFVVD